MSIVLQFIYQLNSGHLPDPASHLLYLDYKAHECYPPVSFLTQTSSANGNTKKNQINHLSIYIKKKKIFKTIRKNCYLENRKLCNVITHTKLAKLNVFPLQNPKPLSKKNTHTQLIRTEFVFFTVKQIESRQSLLTCQPSKRLRIHQRYLQFAAAIAKLIFVVLLKKQIFC